MRLTGKQAAFVDYYFLCGANATEAARRAGYSPRTARQQGSRLLTHVDIQAAIQQRMMERAMSAETVLYLLAQIARGDIGDYLDLDTRRPTLNVQKAVGKTYALKMLRYGNGTLLIEMKDSLRALELIGKYHGLWKGKVQVGLAADGSDSRCMSDDERAARLMEIVDRARARQDGEAADGTTEGQPGTTTV